MSAKQFLQEAHTFEQIRSTTWQGPSARSGRRYQTSVKEDQQPLNMNNNNNNNNNPTSDVLWERLIIAAGDDQQARQAVAFMQRRLLEDVDNMPLDHIEMIAGE